MKWVIVAGCLASLAEAGCKSCEYAGPASPAAQPAWLAGLEKMRSDVRAQISYNASIYAVPELAWTQTSYMQPQMHPYDRFFYDPEQGYTVDRFLDDLKDRYGGVDSILMWPTYTNIGTDDRNQFDLFRCMPGGLDGVRNATLQLQARGVRVLWPYNPWDTGTHREPLSDEDTFAKLLKQTNGDGFNGDTMGFVPESFYASAVAADYPIAFEPEGGGTDAALNWATMGWGYWSYPTVPGVDRQKYITGGKFMTNICNRWAQTKTNDLQSAWFNGCGYETWENVWGTWNGIAPRDGEAIRRVGAMLRFFGGKVDSTSFPTPARDFLHSPLWEPHWPGAMQASVFASRFPLGNDTTHNVYTVINRSGKNTTGQQLWLEGPLPPSAVIYDCYRGVELKPEAPIAPTPDPVPAAYNAYYDSNSYSGHGGDDIDENPVTNMTVPQCTARCDANANCSCVTFMPQSGSDAGSCWMRANCQPESFKGDSAYRVYTKKAQYTTWSGRNCYDGNGGDDIDNSPVPNMTAAQCMARCDADAKCGCVTYDPKAQQCWKRANCVPTQFKQAGQYTTYVRQQMQPACAGGGACAGPPPPPAGAVAVSFDLEANGYGCVLQTTTPHDAELTTFLQSMAGMTAKPLYEYDETWRYLNQTRVEIAKTTPRSAAPAGTVLVPKNDAWSFVVKGVEIEGDDNHGVDVQYPWEAHPMREHSHTLSVGPLYVDEYPVTCANYSAYIAATGFKPADDYRWLKNWNGSATPPAAIADLPVTYVSLDEARAYCAWKGARLPHEHEWQYAAQGNDGRAYPWGKDADKSKLPDLHAGTVDGGRESVFAHEGGASPFGVKDLVGNAWQYTDEFQDAHTRGVILRGGSNYRPDGSHRYFPQVRDSLATHNKYFLLSDRYERAGTIGFRCVYDAAESE
jgi:formylglycine-generating enzyme required for sulfatase activity